MLCGERVDEIATSAQWCHTHLKTHFLFDFTINTTMFWIKPMFTCSIIMSVPYHQYGSPLTITLNQTFRNTLSISNKGETFSRCEFTKFLWCEYIAIMSGLLLTDISPHMSATRREEIVNYDGKWTKCFCQKTWPIGLLILKCTVLQKVIAPCRHRAMLQHSHGSTNC